MNPTLTVDLAKLSSNAQVLTQKLAEHNINCAFVTKVFCAEPTMVKVLDSSDCKYLADSRIQNFEKYGRVKKEKIMLRAPTADIAERTVALTDIACVSDIATLLALERSANKLVSLYKILLMIDLGDLREGIYFDDAVTIDKFVECVITCNHLELVGIGTNLTCYGSVLPTVENMTTLSQIAEHIEEKYNLKLEIVSGGNSSSIDLVESGQMPMKINNLRLGESLVLGVETAHGKPIEGTFNDVVTLTATVIEVYNKPSMPVGQRSMNAFGEKVEYTDMGIMKRAILAVGRQDIDPDGLIPMGNYEVIGSSSDHLIVNVSQMEQINVGDSLSFRLNYGATLRAFTSPYVDKVYK